MSFPLKGERADKRVKGRGPYGVLRAVVIGFGFGIFAAGAAGCVGGSPPPSPPSGKQAVAKPPAPVPTAVPEQKTEGQIPPPAPYVYNAEGRRDPFQSILVTAESRNLQSLPPLLRTEIGELRLIGIVWGGFGYSAMVQTPDGKGYTIRVGTPVGPNNGAVRKITERYLTIEEKYTDIFGEKKVREVKLDLHPQKEGSE